MAQTITKLPITKNEPPRQGTAFWPPFLSLQREVNQLFDQFDRGWRPAFQQSLPNLEPSGWPDVLWSSSPAVDVLDKETAYEVSAEVPGMDADNLDVKLVNGNLIIKGEKKESREQNKGDSRLSERRYGSFERAFRVPDDVDFDKVEASLKSGILTVILPKRTEAVKPATRIEVKAA